VLHNKTAQESIYFQPEPYKSIILKQQPSPGEVNARVSSSRLHTWPRWPQCTSRGAVGGTASLELV
jgi:hypothetical protein